MQSKADFLEGVRGNWYIGKFAAEVCQWAIGEKEDIFLDYLARKEKTEEGYVEEVHYVITDRRVLHFDLTHESFQYRTILSRNTLSSIRQEFHVPKDPEGWVVCPPCPNAEIVLVGRKDPYVIQAPTRENYRSSYKEFLIALAALFPKVES